MDKNTSAQPLQVQHLTKSNGLRLVYPAESYTLPAEFLRVHSPSAEVRQHGRPVLVYGKNEVRLLGLEVMGHYGIKLLFNDGHDSGIYAWHYLFNLAQQQSQLWDTYLNKLHAAKLSRHAQTQVVNIMDPKAN